MLQRLTLLLCTLGFSNSLPLSSAPSQPSPGYTVMVPVTVMGSFGPQVVLVPVSGSDWNLPRNHNPTAQLTQTAQQPDPQNQHPPEGPHVNSPFLQIPPSPPPDTLTPENQLPQGQILPVWNSLPAVVPLQPSVVNGQTFVPVWLPPAGGGGTAGGVGGATGGAAGGAAGGAGGQMQVVSVAQQPEQSESASSEEGDTQVIYMLPISAEIQNMGITEGEQGGVQPDPNANIQQKPEPNANANARPDPNLGFLQDVLTPAPPAAGIQDTPAPPGIGPLGAGQRTSTGRRFGVTGGTAAPCKHSGGAAVAVGAGGL